MALTDKFLKTTLNKPQEKRFFVSDRDSMGARISTTGTITFQLRYRWPNATKNSGYEQVWFDLGNYPQMSLKQAREDAIKWKRLVKEGKDPRIVRKTAVSENLNKVTVGYLVEEWFTKVCAVEKKNAQKLYKGPLDKYVVSQFGDLPWDDVTLQGWLKMLEQVKAKYPIRSNQLLTSIKQIGKWAIKRNFITENPLQNIGAKDLGIIKVPRERALSNIELHYVIRALDECRMSRKNALLVYLLLFFGCRTQELRCAERSHFDFDKMIWTVPPELNKVSRKEKPAAIQRPIIDEIKPYIEAAFNLSGSNKYMFTNENSDKVMGRTCTLPLPRHICNYSKKHLAYEIEDFTCHDLRRTARTNWSELTQPHVSEKMLGHKLGGVFETYDKHSYLKEQAEAYKAWFLRLESIKADPEKIIHIDDWRARA